MQLEIGQLDRKYASLRIEARQRRGQLTASLSQYGQQTPVVVVPTDTADRYVLVDGYLRVSALEELSRDVVTAVAVAMDEAAALVMGHRLDNARRRSGLEEGWLLAELLEQGRRPVELSVLLGRSRSWVSRRLSLVRVLPSSVQDAVRRGALSPHVAMKYLVPLARANEAQCERLVERLGKQGPTSRDMQRLYTAWLAGDAEQRARIVEHPELYLKAETELGDGEDIERRAALLRRDFEMLASVCWRARHRLEEGMVESLTRQRRVRLQRAFDDARHGFASLCARLPPEVTSDARPGDTHSDSATAP